MRRGIDRVALNRRITRVEVGRERTVRRTSREALIDGLSGAQIVATRRHGKYLLCDLDSGDAVMIHLRMSGRVLVVDAGTPRPPHTHVVAHLEATSEFARGELWFVDPRTFGEVVVFDPEHPEVLVPELARLGPDPLATGFTDGVLAERLRGKRTNLKATLLDQGVVAGIGNIYADEILHRAKLTPPSHGGIAAALDHRATACLDRGGARACRGGRWQHADRHPIRGYRGERGVVPTRASCLWTGR